MNHRPGEHKSTSVTRFLCTNPLKLQKRFKLVEKKNGEKKAKPIPLIEGIYYISPTGTGEVAPLKLCSVWWALTHKFDRHMKKGMGVQHKAIMVAGTHELRLRELALLTHTKS